METRRLNQPPAETTPASRLEAQSHSTRERQDNTPETRKPRGFEGRHHTPEAKAKISVANKGKKHTPETKAKMSEAKKGKKNPNHGKKLSPEHRAKISEANKGKKYTPETKAKLSEAMKGEKNPNYGNKLSPEHRAKISESKKGKKNPMYGRVYSEEEKALLREIALGSQHSEESKDQIRETQLNRRRPKEAEVAQAQAVYEQLAIGDPRRDLVALHFGFGIYQPHSTHQIASMFGRNRDWAQQNFSLIKSGGNPQPRFLSS